MVSFNRGIDEFCNNYRVDYSGGFTTYYPTDPLVTTFTGLFMCTAFAGMTRGLGATRVFLGEKTKPVLPRLRSAEVGSLVNGGMN